MTVTAFGTHTINALIAKPVTINKLHEALRRFPVGLLRTH